MDEKKRPVSLFGPVLLIVVGLILLMNSLGYLDWSVWWSLLRLWPVLLIAAGLDILLGRRSIWGSLLAVVLVAGVALGALWLSEVGPAGTEPGEVIRQPLDGVTEAAVILNPAVGILRLQALPESADLVRGTVGAGQGAEVVQEVEQDGTRVTFVLREEGVPWVPFVAGPNNQQVWDLGLSPAPELDLQVDVALGEADLDLTGLSLRDLGLNMGLGLVEVVFPSGGRYEARVEGAMGSTTIVVPGDLPARIRVDGGLAVRQVPEGFRQEGAVYTSPDYDTAQDRLDLAVSQAIGLLRIRQAE